MKRFVSWAIALVAAWLSLTGVAQAADLDNGAKIFNANCAACHAGGRNVVNAAKTLQKDALAQFGMNSVDAIKKQVTNGNGAMPAFGGKLSADDIEDVASYVLSKSEAGW
jgi:cytochrome c6